jgi:hypothetical protein
VPLQAPNSKIVLVTVVGELRLKKINLRH